MKITKKSLTIVFAVVIAGVALQFAIGPFDFSILAFPVNLIFLLILLVLTVVKQTSAVERFGTLSLSIIIISVLTLLSIIMGLIPENSVKGSWPFVLTYLMLLTNLALVIGRRIRVIKLKDFGFMLNHTGLFILLFSAGFGSADRGKYLMRVDEGKIEWRGERYGVGGIVELPVAILLEDFEMEEYPTTLAVTYPEPKSFSSKVEVYTEGGGTKRGVIKVNHPLTIGNWKVYQYSYNSQMGRDSDYSVFELVYDPWLIPAYIGIIMLFLGAITLFWKGGRR